MGSNKWSGWIAFAGWLMVIIGVLDFFEGLIAVIRGQYFVLTANQILVFDMRTWGWLMMIWGIVAVLAGLGLLSGAGWARWVVIIVAIISILGQLGFVGGAQYPLWALTVLALTFVVLYALIARWDDATSTA